MRTAVPSPGPPGCPTRRLGVVAVAAVVGLVACSGGDAGPTDPLLDDRPRAENEAPPPTLAGGLALEELDPATMFVGAALAFGTPLPSRQAAAEALTVDPEVGTATVRAVYDAASARRLGEVLVLGLVGSELFDEEALAAFESALVRSLGGNDGTELSIAGRPVRRTTGPEGSVVSFRESNLLVVVTAFESADAVLVATRQIEARARGEAGTAVPVTPLPATPVGTAFVPIPTLSFTPFPPPEEEVEPEPPALAGATAVQGRYGVVAGERRTLVWAFTVDPATYPSAESLEPAMRDVAAARGGGSAPQVVEVVDRVVLASTSAAGQPSAHVFRHGGLVLVVEGTEPSQLDAVTTAWIAALAGQ